MLLIGLTLLVVISSNFSGPFVLGSSYEHVGCRSLPISILGSGENSLDLLSPLFPEVLTVAEIISCYYNLSDL